MNITKPLAFILLAAALALPVSAAEFSFAAPPPGQMVTGHFTQELPSGAHATGRFWIAGKGLSRWEQTGPHQMLLVSSGRSAWQVEPDLNQAVLHHLPENDLFTALQAAELQRAPARPSVFTGEVKGVGRVEVHMAPGALMPSMVVQREEGVTTRFSQVRQARLSPSLFRYTPPAGMDVLR